MLRPIAIATAISGTLDIAFAMILTLLFGREIGNMLRFVASGPFPQATEWGAGGAILGLVVHFALMAILAIAFMLVIRQRPELVRKPIAAGIIYGLITYVAMNLIAVQLRFHPGFPPKPLSIATQLFAHIVLVGIPMALIARRYFPRAET
jgi:hypothetical protein